MKKIIAFFLVAFFLCTTAVSALSNNLAEEKTTAPVVTETPDYDLPYPGMLPDHPLYKIKTLRNKIILFLIRDPLKKAAKHLEMADKEFYAALKLAEKDKLPLAQHTAFKAEHHMTLLVTEIKNAVYYSNQEFPQDLAQRAHQAAEKHQGVLAGIMSRANEEQKKTLITIQEFSLRNDEGLTKLQEELELEKLELED